MTGARLPLVDMHTTLALDEAVRRVAINRGLYPAIVTGDVEVRLRLLAGLLAEIHTDITYYVGAARARNIGWARIGVLLGLPALEARHRYQPGSPGRRSAEHTPSE